MAKRLAQRRKFKLNSRLALKFSFFRLYEIYKSSWNHSNLLSQQLLCLCYFLFYTNVAVHCPFLLYVFTSVLIFSCSLCWSCLPVSSWPILVISNSWMNLNPIELSFHTGLCIANCFLVNLFPCQKLEDLWILSP